MTDSGEYYLRTPENVFVFYNFETNEYMHGDGLDLDLIEQNLPDPIGNILNVLLDSTDVFLDIGASNGYFYSLRLAKRFPRAQIFAFEPNPKILYHLKKNVSYNHLDNIQIMPIGLSDAAGESPLAYELGASSYLLPKSESGLSSIIVHTDKLDNLVSQKIVTQVNVIKVDIEGNELAFLHGAKRSLAKFAPVIIMEFKERLLRRAGVNREEVADFLRESGYLIFSVEGSEDVVCIPKANKSAMSKIK
ncbi:MAG: FkbM family methyltransferase [Chloroflexi bacterium]|nr:FkbM family methyltransferase [Chloroflexota bacterium]